MTRDTLTAWYGSAEVAEAVERGLLGNADRALAAAQQVERIRMRTASEARSNKVKARMATQPIRDKGEFNHERRPAPRRDDGIVAMALRAMPALQAAWSSSRAP